MTELFKYQDEDEPFFLTHHKSLMLYEPRLGKTVLTCKILAKDPETSSILIACAKSAMGTWISHVRYWFDKIRGPGNYTLEFRILRSKGPNAKTTRMALWRKPRTAQITVYLCTFAALIYDDKDIQGIKFKTVIGDEVHKVLKGRTTKTANIFRARVRDAHRFHALSGTLAGKWGPGDYWTLLNIINRNEFSSYWSFLNTYCILINNGFGQEIVGLQNMEAFHRQLSRYARIRRRAECAPYMPTVKRQILWVEMDKAQEKMYTELGGKSQLTFTESGTLLVAANSLEKFTRKRQILASPKILDPDGKSFGGAINDLLERLEDAEEEEDLDAQHIVVFSSSRKALPHIEAALRGHGHRNVFTIAGGTEPEELKAAQEAFERTRGIMLSTTQFAQGFSLSTARMCYHISFDLDPNNNKQAEDRLVGIEGDHNIMSYYYCYRHTDDEELSGRVEDRDEIIKITTDSSIVRPIMFKDKFVEWTPITDE